ACEWGHIPGHASPATVADHAPRRTLWSWRLRGRAPPPGAPVGLTPVNDHRHVVLVLVVLEELWIQLLGQRLGDNAIDHQASILLFSRKYTRCSSNSDTPQRAVA